MSESERTVCLGDERLFTFDVVLSPRCVQQSVYRQCVRTLVRAAVDGYNATVLAYGQTGSGKTYTMGTSWETGDGQEEDDCVLGEVDHPDVHSDSDGDEDGEEAEEECPQTARRGIIPRAIRQLFRTMRRIRRRARTKGHEPPEFMVHAQFTELYNEELIDLLEPAGPLRGALKLTEDGSGGVHIAGATRRAVNSAAAALAALREGALARTTAATRMNAASSRSHAVFTLLLHQRRRMYQELHDDTAAEAEYETLSAKFHFVDLAGSERLKRTGATGDRAKEGISINCGLLALGNVISALGDRSRRAAHVPYRDSKLTRLLQDSLGGNSRTLMVACVSAVDADFTETLSTLKYANRARNIRNRCVLNQDVSSRTVRALREELARVRLELQEYRQGRRTADGWSDAARENALLTAELETSRARLAAAHAALSALTARHAALVADSDVPRDAEGQDCALTALVAGYVQEIERLRAQLLQRSAEHEYRHKRAALVRPTDAADLIGDAKRELDQEKELLARSMGELELQRKIGGGDGPGERERAEGESAGEGESDEDGAEGDDDDEAERKCAAMTAELAALSDDIDTKARLVEQLEDSERRMQELRRRYESRLQELQGRLRGPGTAVAGGAGPPASGGQAARHLARLREELARLRNERVQLVRRMRQEAADHRRAHLAKNKEVARLRKESRKNANLIRTLEADRNLKEQVLRRKQEEVSLLRRSQRSRTRRGTGAVRQSEQQAERQWERVSRWLQRAVAARTLTAELQRSLEHAAQQKHRLQASGAGDDLHLQYLQRTVRDTQHQLQLLTERDDLPDLRALLASLDEAAARAVLERALRAAVTATAQADEHRTELGQARAQLRHLQLRLLSDVDLANVSSGTSTRPVSPVREGSLPPYEEPPETQSSPSEPFERNAVRRGSVRLRDLGVFPGVTEGMTRSLHEEGRPAPLCRVPSAPGSLRTLVPSPAGERRTTLARPHASAATGETPPQSPRMSRRTRDEDVFLRLAPGNRQKDEPRVAVRQIRHKRMSGDGLRCTHVCEGHAGPVQALAADSEHVYSGGADRSVRAWDVRVGRQVWRAGGGGGPLCLTQRGLAAGGTDPVRLWDPRKGASVAAAHLGSDSSGVAVLAEGLYADELYTAAGDRLRLWDLRMLSCLWTARCGHAAAVTSAAACGAGVVTGSRDHSVRLVRRAGSDASTRAFSPPHYDGVQALCSPAAGVVFSGSRDGSVKRWLVSERGGEEAGVMRSAHAGWVSGLTTDESGAPVSCGRDGAVCVWAQWEEWDEWAGARAAGRAPEPQLAVAAAAGIVYTSGTDGVLRCWCWRTGR